MSTAMPVCSISRQHIDQRHLDLGEQSVAAGALDLVVERLRQVEHGPGVQHGGLARPSPSSSNSMPWSPSPSCWSSRWR